MTYRAVALSQVDGTGGESIGLDVAQRLGFGYLNEAIVARVANEHGVGPASVAEAERRKSLFDRMIEAAGRSAVDGATMVAYPNLFDETDTLLSLIRDAVRDAAGRGDVVLVAHAACYACADLSDVLRVSITAPQSTRVARVAEAQGIDEKEAARVLKKSDAGRAAYLKRAHGIAKEAPADYDLVINTERVTPAEAVDLIFSLVQP
jgi:cytidylate kinase